MVKGLLCASQVTRFEAGKELFSALIAFLGVRKVTTQNLGGGGVQAQSHGSYSLRVGALGHQVHQVHQLPP